MYKISFRDRWDELKMENYFISSNNDIIKVDDFKDFATKYVLSNYPGSDQYGDPQTRLILDGWIRIQDNIVELSEERLHQLKLFLLEKRYVGDSELILQLWNAFGEKYEVRSTPSQVISQN